MICLVKFVLERGKIVCNVLKVFICFIFILIIIFGLIICWGLKNFFIVICFEKDINGSMFNLILVCSKLEIINFLLVKIKLLFWRCGRNMLLFFCVIWFDVWKFYFFDIKEIKLLGVIFINILNVLWYLYLFYVRYCVFKLFGFL